MALDFTSDFETGNGELVDASGDELHFRAESKRGAWILWWHFELRDVAARKLTIVLDNAGEVMGKLTSLSRVHPVVNLGGKDWHRLAPGTVDELAGTWRFAAHFPRDRDVARVAFCYPYGYSEALRQARGWAKAGAELRSLCESPGGREVPMLVFGDAQAQGRELVVAVARQHAGETPGSFVLEGFVEAFVASGECGRWLREQGVLVVVPVMDVDSVAEGGFGKWQPPVDFNRDWAGDSRWPQIRALRGVIEELAARHRYRLFLDFHAPCAHEPNFLALHPDEVLPPGPRAGQKLFGELLATHQSHWFDFHPEDSYICASEDGVSAIAQAREHGCTAVVIETTYHLTRNGRIASPLRYRQHGQAVAIAAVAFVREQRGSGF
ncbi:MAG: M14-type cytosolic carboxypeptidase [Armatimonadota bacterium]